MRGRGGGRARVDRRWRLLVFPIEEMREVPKGRGVIIMGLDRTEKLISVGLTKHLLHRARKGCLVAHKMKPTEVAYGPNRS